jgi:nucleotide-binding universal stress UspA family protein
VFIFASDSGWYFSRVTSPANALRPKSLELIVAATDGSAPANHALEHARSLAGRAGARLQVLTVETVGTAPGSASPGVAQPLSLPGMLTRRGVPGIEIVRCAEQLRAGLVVLGRSPCPAHPAIGLGSTLDVVVRRRDGLSLLIPPGIGGMTRMVVALDGTGRGLDMLAPALEFAGALDLEVLPVHVTPERAGETGSWDSPNVRRIRTGLQQAGLSAPLVIRAGNPIPEILAHLAETGADLLAVGVRRGWHPGDLGSGHVGRDLLRMAPVAILTVPI